MNYKTILAEFFSTCDGIVRDVFFSVYSILESLDKTEQPAAFMYVCENALNSKSDYSNRIEKNYYTDMQVQKADEKINKKFMPALNALIEESARNSVSPLDFYAHVWDLIQSPILKTKRERALAVFRVVNHKLIPYRSVGIGLSMDDELFDNIVDDLENSVLADTEYILKLDYEQKTQRASLLLDKLLALKSVEEQVVYMSIIMNEVENNIRHEVKAALERI